MNKSKSAGLILAGGQGTRMGGKDKGLVEIGGESFTARLTTTFQAISLPVFISCNRNQDYYRQFTSRLISDTSYPNQGPLAGIYNTLEKLDLSQHQHLLIAPVDAPFLSEVVFTQLLESHLNHHRDIDITIAHDGNRLQPLVCCLNSHLKESLGEFLAAGGRKTQKWMMAQKHQIIDFDVQDKSFKNINDANELSKLSEPGHD